MKTATPLYHKLDSGYRVRCMLEEYNRAMQSLMRGLSASMYGDGSKKDADVD